MLKKKRKYKKNFLFFFRNASKLRALRWVTAATYSRWFERRRWLRVAVNIRLLSQTSFDGLTSVAKSSTRFKFLHENNVTVCVIFTVATIIVAQQNNNREPLTKTLSFLRISTRMVFARRQIDCNAIIYVGFEVVRQNLLLPSSLLKFDSLNITFLQDFQMLPQNVSREWRSSREKIFFSHRTNIFSLHVKLLDRDSF